MKTCRFFVTALLIFIPSLARAEDVPNPLFNGHEDWFFCQSNSDCVSVETICGTVIDSGTQIALRPVINRSYETPFKDFVSNHVAITAATTAGGYEHPLPCRLDPEPPGTRTYTCINNYCAAIYQ